MGTGERNNPFANLKEHLIIAAPSATAAPQDCSAAGLANTVSSATGSARAYLADDPGANQAVTAAFHQPRGEATNVTVLPPDLASAYGQFMAG